MAYSKAPSQETYQTKDLPLIWELTSRDAATVKDAIAINGHFDVIKNDDAKASDFVFMKRDGSHKYPYSAPSEIRGLHYWEDQDKLYVAYGDKLDVVTGSNGTKITTLSLFATEEGHVGFSEFYYEDGTTELVVTDGERMWTIKPDDSSTQVTDADLPTPLSPYPVFLDGYIFIAKKDTADIYNSALDDPSSWVPGDFISAEMLPDTLKRVARLNNYLVAFGSASVEYFFDAAHASGSPLQRNDTPVKLIGYLGGYASFSNKTFFVGQAQDTTPEIYYLEDFKMEEIGSPAIRRALQEVSDYDACIISSGGKDFYVLSTESLTFAYDLKTKLWTRWAFKDWNKFPAYLSCGIPLSVGGHCSVFAIRGSNNLYYMDPNTYQDENEDFTVMVQTRRQNFDTQRDKQMSQLIVIGDSTPANVQVTYSDNDYQTFSSPRTINMMSRRKILTRLGRFRERAFKVTFAGNAPLRLTRMEVSFNIWSR